ncbi:mRNA-decapping enzyme subunit 2 [Elasticomyces elasticus]|nr:mRNA-decapping enzyme subunit 2 [Elasticomyces elasticus]
MAAFSQFLAYKVRVPVRGAIMLNEEMDSVVLVKGWKKSSGWSFPRGKINKEEKDLDCAIREVWEETGYDVRQAGLVTDQSATNHIDVVMREQHMRLFVFRGVPMDTHFEPRTRKEISKIQWYKLSDLPTFKKNKQQEQGQDVGNANKFYMVAPFLGPLKTWIKHQRRLGAQTTETSADCPPHRHTILGRSSEVSGQSQASTLAPFADDDLATALLRTLQHGAPPDVDTSLTDPITHLVPPEDSAAELRRLLGIGRPVQSETQAAKCKDGQANALLSILRSGPQPGLEVPKAHPILPKTPLEQVTMFPEEPSSPTHHHNQRKATQSMQTPPPVFPLSPARVASQHLGSIVQHGPDMRTMHDSRQLSSNSLTTSHPSSSSLARPAIPSLHHPQDESQHLSPRLPPHETNPFQPVDHQLPANGSGGLNVTGTRTFPASSLPPPKLDRHTQSLLNAFKGSVATSSAGESLAGLQAADTWAAPQQYLPSRNTEPPAADPRTLSARDTSHRINDFNRTSMPDESMMPLPSEPKSAHQASLLSLFHKSPASHIGTPPPMFVNQIPPRPSGPTPAAGVKVHPSVTNTPQSPGMAKLDAFSYPSQHISLSEVTRTSPKVDPVPVKLAEKKTPDVSVPAGSVQSHPQAINGISRRPASALASKAMKSSSFAPTTILTRPSSARHVGLPRHESQPVLAAPASTSPLHGGQRTRSATPTTILARPSSTKATSRPRPDLNAGVGATSSNEARAPATAPKAPIRILARPSPAKPTSPSQSISSPPIALVLPKKIEELAPSPPQSQHCPKPVVVVSQPASQIFQPAKSNRQESSAITEKNSLLALFGKPPSRPTSPLGNTPLTNVFLPGKTPVSYLPLHEQQRRQRESTTPMVINAGESTGAKLSGKPTETKDFLLGFLNRVVEKEHHQGARREA